MPRPIVHSDFLKSVPETVTSVKRVEETEYNKIKSEIRRISDRMVDEERKEIKGDAERVYLHELTEIEDRKNERKKKESTTTTTDKKNV